MTASSDAALAVVLASELRAASHHLSGRWLELVAARPTSRVDPVLQSRQLLETIPLLITGVASYLEEPVEDVLSVLPAAAKAMELGEIRYAQGFEALEILKQYEVLETVLFDFVTGVIASGASSDPQAVAVCTYRVTRAVSMFEQATIGRFLRAASERTRKKEQRLRSFNRLISHELKNRIGAIRGAAETLQERWMDDQNSNRRRFLGMIAENAQEMQAVIKDLVELSMLEPDSRQQRNLPLDEAVGEVFRQMREFARSRNVNVRIAGELPRVEVPAAVVELCLSNYISNGVKYHDPAKNDRYVEIRAHMENETDPAKRRLVVSVRDNGLGMSELARKQLFNRFFRAHAGVIDVEGMGLGLSIVRETLASMGGEAWADFGDSGETIFAFGIPCRRASDRIEASGNATPAAPATATNVEQNVDAEHPRTDIAEAATDAAPTTTAPTES